MTLLAQEVIRRKREGAELTAAELDFVVRGITDNSLSEGQVAAFAMTVFFRGMTMAERVAFTRAMVASGEQLSWADQDLPGPVLDKHSTGGVGDKVSLMLGPLVAACGGCVPMISGRGLGHTGGTLDKLESIPGYCITPDQASFRRTVREVGCAIIGQTDNLAPADRRLYGIRDVTATVDSIPLITASILSKKLAAGLDALVMDIKCGSGAFAAEPAMAEELADSIVQVCNGAGLPCVGLITDMDQVLGSTVGNALELQETLDYLTGRQRQPRLHSLVLELAAEMLLLGGLATDVASGRARAEAALDNGSAAEVFGRMVHALGGPADLLAQTAFPSAPVVVPCPAPSAGVVQAMDARALGMAVVELGGGRRVPTDRVDHRVGLSACCQIGDSVGPDQPLALVHAASAAAADTAINQLQAAIAVADQAAPSRPVVLQRVTPA